MKRKAPGRGPWAFFQAFILGGATLALWVMPQWSWDGNVQVEGLHYLSSQLILRTAALPTKGRLFQIDPAKIRSRLLQLDAVEDAKVRRWLFPARLDIEIKERTPMVRLLGTTPPTYLDNQGIPFTLPASSSPPTRLSVSIASGTLTPEDRLDLQTLLLNWPTGSRGTLKICDPASWSATIDGVPVVLGSGDNLGEKLHLYSQLLPLARRAEKAVEYIDLRFPEAPTLRASEATH